MKYLHVSEVLKPSHDGKLASLRGWAYRVRKQKKFIFIILRDSTGLIQCIIKEGSKAFKVAEKVTTESSIQLRGIVKKDKRAPTGYEVQVKDLEIVGLAETYPIARDLSDEFLLSVRHLWVRDPKMQAIWIIRAKVFEALREYFKKEGYHEVHAPFITMASESGLEMFKVDYYGKDVRLAQTWQFYAEAMMHSLEKIYTIAPSFRAEKSRTTRHLTEYWHTEIEVAWMDLDGLAVESERIISYACQKVAKDCKKELKTLGVDATKLAKVKPPFPRITYKKAIEILKKDGMKVKAGKDLRTLEERQLMTHYSKPLIVTHYPKGAMAFYKRRDPKDPKVAMCLDVLLPSGTEVIGGSERDLDIKEMKKVLKATGEDIKDYEWYFDTRRYGAIPHSGFGLGTDRLVQWICGLKDIKDAIPFPRTPTRCYP